MKQILKQKESQTLEFKTSFGREAIETLVAFANASGGELYIGISDLFSELDTVLTFIRKHISKHFIITGKAQRDEVWEYPLDAIREIVLNMIVRRDYRASADSTIKIFSNRIEFYNPGILLPGLTLKDILSGNSPSIPRNKQIASVFKEAGVIEKYGSGIKRVR